MRSWIRKTLAKNLALKIISLALALLLFVVAHTEKNSLAQGPVPVTFKTPAGKVLVSRPPNAISVGVIGPVSRIRRFRFDELGTLGIDLTQVREGFFKFKDELVRLPTGLKVAFIQPEGFSVRYEPLAQRHLPVRVILQGEVAPGFRLKSRSLTPAMATVSGPRSLILALSELHLEPVKLEGASASIHQSKPIIALPPEVRVDPAGPIEVRLDIEPILTEVTLSGVPLFFEDETGRKGQMKLVKVKVKLEGPARLLANLPRSKLMAKVRSKKEQSGRISLSPTVEGLPPEVRVLHITPSGVEVEIGRDTVPDSRNRSPKPIGKGRGATGSNSK